MRRIIAAAALALATALAGATTAQEQSRPPLTDMSEAEREALRIEVRAYLLEHPEVLMEAISVLEARREASKRQTDSELIAANYDRIFNDPNAWVGGNPEGEITLVEFSDYRCGYCKKAHPEVLELLKRDPNIRFVVKEFPILGPDSVAAARLALAATIIDPAKFGALHDALMGFEGSLEEELAYAIAEEAGYDVAALKETAQSAEVEARIAENYALARALGLTGTPGFVLGDRMIRGYMPLNAMLAAVAEVRAALD